jgi:hypothetical protein
MILKPEKEYVKNFKPACTPVREKKIEGARESLLLPLQDQVEVVEAVDVNGHLVHRLHRVGRRKARRIAFSVADAGKIDHALSSPRERDRIHQPLGLPDSGSLERKPMGPFIWLITAYQPTRAQINSRTLCVTFFYSTRQPVLD